MAFKAQPAPKCVSCSESVYPMEKIDYDGQTFHLSCFKCLHCKNTVQLTGVAMIKGDLYCKNCFMKIFKREGKYSSFETPSRSPNASPAPTTAAPAPAASPSPTLKPEVSRPKTLPTHTNGTNGTTPTKPVEKSNGLPPTSPTSIVAPKAVSMSSSPVTVIDDSLSNPPSRDSAESVRRRSTILLESCVADDCENPRVARYSYCTKHGNYDVQELKPLVEAVEKRDASGVRNLFQNTPASIIFKTSRDGISPLEMAFAGIRNSRGCGIAMVSAIKTHIEKLENENKSLKEQQTLLEQAVAKHVKGGSAPAPAPAADQSAEVAKLQAENKALKEQQALLEQAVAKHVKAATSAPAAVDQSAEVAKLQAENKALKEQQALLEQAVAKHVKAAAAAPAPAAAPAVDQSAEVATLQAQVKQLEDAVGKSIKARADLVDQVTKHKDAAKAWETEKATLLEQQSQLEAALAKRMAQVSA